MSKSVKLTKPYDRMIENVKGYLSKIFVEDSLLLSEILLIPKRFSKFGDMIVYNESLRPLLASDLYQGLSEDHKSCLWETVALSLAGARVAVVYSIIGGSGTREPLSRMLLGDSSIARYTENGIVYSWDVCKVMFSRGNVSEKIRMSQLNCGKEIVVDMFAGIGYFSLSFLVHCGAARVYSCEWNAEAVRWLRNNLVTNGVKAGRSVVLEGDCEAVAPRGVAQRVSMGLVPDCRRYWRVGCEVLDARSGGVIHVHENVASFGGVTEAASLGADGHCVGTRDSQGHCAGARDSQGHCGAAGDSQGHCGASGDSQGHCGAPGEPVGAMTCSRAPVPQPWVEFAREATAAMETHLRDIHGEAWRVTAVHLQHVKSYAPHIDHLVLDLECRPLS